MGSCPQAGNVIATNTSDKIRVGVWRCIAHHPTAGFVEDQDLFFQLGLGHAQTLFVCAP
jgi:hypothetical protein